MERWPPHLTEILRGDLVVAFGYRTRAAGVVATPMVTLGLYDEAAATITMSTSFGMGKKLTRIEQDDRVALLFHARDHGTASARNVVLVQGHARFPDRPDGTWVTPEVETAWRRMLVPRRRGRLWDWIGHEYYDLRVPISVTMRRVVVWPDATVAEVPAVLGAPLPADPPASQDPPQGGTRARVPAKRYGKRFQRGMHRLVGWAGSDGFPMIVPAAMTVAGANIRIESPALPDGVRRAGVLAHWFEPRCNGQGNAVLTGWLEAEGGAGWFRPHTVAGYTMPRLDDVGFSLAAGLGAKAGYRRMVKAGHVRDGVWQPQRGR
ncbi:hypothetical protein [Nitriliruptor alkaliphilus]|uniref:hypothetical protein n=1 Tax=Nitriliruptor alkaliphilus TaxID=427918 RepID=UPI0012EE3E30|nr:hypothetical protein [Nitriliruptor alkaliphilus]